MTIKILLVMFVGFAGGIAVGSGFVAFFTVLGVLPRLTQLTKTMKMIRHYEWSVVIGAMVGCWLSFTPITFNLTAFILVPIGLASGVFVGLLAAALTEVINVLPILAKRIGVHDQIVFLLMAIALGKVFGSLFQWIYFVKHTN